MYNFSLKTSLIIACILILKISYGQENIKPAYVIDLKGDTLKGFIDYRNWEQNPKRITFRKTAGSANIYYTPLDIKKFSVVDEVYESGVVKVDESSTRIELLSNTAEITYKLDTIFLQTLFTGEKSLYFYRDKSRKEHFYTKQGDTFDYLIYKPYQKNVEGKLIITYNKRYVGQLSVYLQDCPKLRDKFSTLTYDQKSITKLFTNYYKCTNKESSFNKKSEKIKLEYGAIVGLSLTKLNISGSNSSAKPTVDFDLSKDVTAGLFLNIVLPRNQGKWSIYNELQYSHFNSKGYGEKHNNYGDFWKTYATYEFTYITMNNMVRYKYQVKRIFLFANAGVANGFAINNSNHKKVVSRVLGFDNTTEGKALDEIRNYEQGINLGIGSKYKNYSFEMRVEKSNGFSTTNSLKTAITRYNFLLGYTF